MAKQIIKLFEQEEFPEEGYIVYKFKITDGTLERLSYHKESSFAEEEALHRRNHKGLGPNFVVGYTHVKNWYRLLCSGNSLKG